MNDLLAEVIEIEECGQRRANQLLAAGYTLIATATKTWEADRRKPGGPGATESYIRHDFRYVIARLEGKPPFPPYEPTGSAEAQAKEETKHD